LSTLDSANDDDNTSDGSSLAHWEGEQADAIRQLIPIAIDGADVTERMRALYYVAGWAIHELRRNLYRAAPGLPDEERAAVMFLLRKRASDALCKLIESATGAARSLQRDFRMFDQGGLSEAQAIDAEAISDRLGLLLSTPRPEPSDLAWMRRAARMARGHDPTRGDSDEIVTIARHVLDVLAMPVLWTNSDGSTLDPRPHTLRDRLERMGYDGPRLPSNEDLAALFSLYGKSRRQGGLKVAGIVEAVARTCIEDFGERGASNRVAQALKDARDKGAIPNEPTPLHRPDGTIPFVSSGYGVKPLRW
jgi:hypothetical protein